MNIKEQTSITSGDRFYQFRLVEISGAAELIITSNPVDDPNNKHARSIPVSPTTERLSPGAMGSNGYYLFLQDDWGSWCWRSTDEQFRGPGRGRVSSDLSGAKLNMLANQQQDGYDPRMLGVSNAVGPMLTMHGRDPDSGVWASPRFPYALMEGFPFPITDRPEPPHYFVVRNEQATIREMRGDTEYQYVIGMNRWLIGSGRVPNLVSHGPVGPSAVSTNPADLNNDGKIDAADLGILIEAFTTQNPIGDINKDGVVDAGDLGVVIGGMGNE